MNWHETLGVMVHRGHSAHDATRAMADAERRGHAIVGPWLVTYEKPAARFDVVRVEDAIAAAYGSHRDRDSERALSFTRGQVTAWAGRELADDEVARLEDAVPNSTFPQTVGLIVASFGFPGQDVTAAGSSSHWIAASAA